ncbi:MAG: hypothetical protein JW709_07140 [Sedimentisphaerales bacterium]|nr:hypothetical protein [Sedimentisphaerales bacterium]
MNSRERVIRAITFRNPDRAPRDCWALPAVSLFERDKYEKLIDRFPMDIQGSQLTPGIDNDITQAIKYGGTYTDEWGCVWHVGEPGVVGEVKHHQLEDMSRLAGFKSPMHLLKQHDHAYVNKLCEQSSNFMLSDVTARPFERIQFLRGTENVFMDLAYGTAQIRKLIEIVHDFYLQDVKSWCQSNVDGIFFMDDWGTMRNLLISPSCWRDIFKPLYRDYCRAIHDAGKYAMFHSDGNIEEIIGDLIDVGVDAINSQLFCMNIEKLSEKYKGKITFWGEMDRQKTLPFGTPADVKKDVWRVRRALDDGKGGLIAQCEWGKCNPAENIHAVYEAWEEPPPNAGQ